MFKKLFEYTIITSQSCSCFAKSHTKICTCTYVPVKVFHMIRLTLKSCLHNWCSKRTESHVVINFGKNTVYNFGK